MRTKLLIGLLLLLLLQIPQKGFTYYVCHPCCCNTFALPGWWMRADYLLLWRKRRFLPPLVTTNPSMAPILGAPGTEILFGNENISRSPQSGGIFDIGVWMTKCLGFGTGFLLVGNEDVNFNASSPTGTPILGRPFFNTSTGLEDVSVIAFPLVNLNGLIKIKNKNRVWEYDLYARFRFLDLCRFKFDLLGGFLTTGIDDYLDIRTNTSLFGLVPQMVEDRFHCTNHYYAGLIGLRSEWRSCNWGVSFVGKVGLGNMVRNVDIHGKTTTTTAGVTTVTHAGLLAQPSNSGRHGTGQFEAVSILEVNVQLRLIEHFWVTLGYTYMFWPSVVLAGDQVDLDVNPTQVPGPVVGPLAPIFDQVNRSFWAQGLTAGISICY
jgi:hypothetical protein